ncbi:phosphoenolpyruvate synthase [Cytophagaceae bacterium ABcell3]|nr:phosphoenolpyruvate synthase [Cytophagaceae bacterium ABcell3]
MKPYILKFEDIDLNNLADTGGKNSSLGEMYRNLASKGVNVPDGFATTAHAWRIFLEKNNLEPVIESILSELDTEEFSNLNDIGERIRTEILKCDIPDDIAEDIRKAYRSLCDKYDSEIQVAVRSSATAEDLPHASFAGQHESYLNIFGEEQLLETCLKCYASLFTNRAIKYRHHHGFEHLQVALSIGVQKMVRSDLSSAGVCFTIDPESGFKDAVLITGAWGLGENVVQGAVDPDEFYVFKPTLKEGYNAIINKKPGAKQRTMIYVTDKDGRNSTANIDTPAEKAEQYVLSDEEILTVAKWSVIIEEHYQKPMDIEWAKDGMTGEIFIVQARPETVHSQVTSTLKISEYSLKEEGKVLAKGKGIGNRVVSGIARILDSPKDAHLLQKGEILITEITNPDWDPILKKASAIVTNKGGRTSHAAIVARELGALAVVGAAGATDNIKDGEWVTVSCEDGTNGIIYEGKLDFEEHVTEINKSDMPDTEVKFIIGDPDKAFKLAAYPNNGVGLMRLEFIINNSIQVHPMALVKFDELKDESVKEQIEQITHHYPDKKEYFVDTLARAVGTIAAAFYPKEVIVRMSDFKTNEYANLIGGSDFEPKEENPMLGFRGASRYYSEAYKEGFGLECRAMKKVRDEMGLHNVKLMVPFCRTVEEGRKVLDIMKHYGLRQGENGLEVYVMAELPSNVLLAREFAEIFDGFSIGSNDLTQLTLGIDRDSSTVSELFNENDLAAKKMISMVIRAAKNAGKKIGLCGQAPSDFPEFARFLVRQGIDSISFNSDALLKGISNIKAAEDAVQKGVEELDELEIKVLNTGL